MPLGRLPCQMAPKCRNGCHTDDWIDQAPDIGNLRGEQEESAHAPQGRGIGLAVTEGELDTWTSSLRTRRARSGVVAAALTDAPTARSSRTTSRPTLLVAPVTSMGSLMDSLAIGAEPLRLNPPTVA
jgi:hypothetical protein